ncbi:unnamed protein product [Schistocephalus solidus]|uniref:Transmembrane protein n=1 Tax=Schistocephalus solidus TaxID=70667 RepID=A0A183TCZ1_SCHSO|nr:unnamed protein product [Schistocephalus solidus]
MSAVHKRLPRKFTAYFQLYDHFKRSPSDSPELAEMQGDERDVDEDSSLRDTPAPADFRLSDEQMDCAFDYFRKEQVAFAFFNVSTVSLSSFRQSNLHLDPIGCLACVQIFAIAWCLNGRVGVLAFSAIVVRVLSTLEVVRRSMEAKPQCRCVWLSNENPKNHDLSGLQLAVPSNPQIIIRSSGLLSTDKAFSAIYVLAQWLHADPGAFPALRGVRAKGTVRAR